MRSSISNSDRPALTAAQSWAIVRPFLVWLVGLSLGLVILSEVAFRLAGVDYPTLGQADMDRGWAGRPGAHGIIGDENKAGVEISINSDGLRDVEHSLNKPADTFRVAVLGNSYTEAFPVPLEQAYWNVTGKELGKCLPPGKEKVEMINFGVGGYGTAQELITLRTQVWKYKPDMVLLGFLTSHDVWYNYRPLSQQAQAPYFVLKNGKLELDDSFKSNIKSQKAKAILLAVQDRLRALGAVTHARGDVKQWIFTTMQELKASKDSSVKVSLLPTDFVYLEPKDEKWVEGWKVTEALLKQMREEVKAAGVPFVVATLSNAIQVNPDPQVRQNFMNQLGVQTLFYPDQRVSALGAKEGFPVVQIAQGLAERATRENVYWHGFPGAMGKGHWNESGNRAAGEAIAAGVCQALKP